MGDVTPGLVAERLRALAGQPGQRDSGEVRWCCDKVTEDPTSWPPGRHGDHLIALAATWAHDGGGCTDPAVVFIAEGMAWREALEMCELIGVPTALAG